MIPDRKTRDLQHGLEKLRRQEDRGEPDKEFSSRKRHGRGPSDCRRGQVSNPPPCGVSQSSFASSARGRIALTMGSGNSQLADGKWFGMLNNHGTRVRLRSIPNTTADLLSSKFRNLEFLKNLCSKNTA